LLSIYQNLRKDRFFLTEKHAGHYIIVEQDFKGKNVRKIGGNYLTRDAAEKALALFADDSGFRWCGKQSEDEDD
jgi:hypothetical protein